MWPPRTRVQMKALGPCHTWSLGEGCREVVVRDALRSSGKRFSVWKFACPGPYKPVLILPSCPSAGPS
jgi:hypothetical protein